MTDLTFIEIKKVKMVENTLSCGCACPGTSYGGVTVGKEYIALEFLESGAVRIMDDDGDNSELYKGEYEIVEDVA